MDETGIEKPNDVADGLDRRPVRARISSYSITGLFVLAACYTLYYAQAILMPVTAALILALLLQPVVRFLGRAKVPEPIAAGVVVVAFFAAFTVGIYFLSDPAAKWISQMPDVVAEVQQKNQSADEANQRRQERDREYGRGGAGRRKSCAVSRSPA